MKRLLAVGVATAAILALPSVAAAQSGHFIGTQTCTDIGTQAQCSGKVAGLGGTTFTVTMSANGTASVECHSPAGNVAPAGSCPNDKWTAVVTDVQFTTATISLFEDSTLSDQVTVPVS